LERPNADESHCASAQRRLHAFLGAELIGACARADALGFGGAQLFDVLGHEAAADLEAAQRAAHAAAGAVQQLDASGCESMPSFEI
jgi:hypothetical protein